MAEEVYLGDELMVSLDPLFQAALEKWKSEMEANYKSVVQGRRDFREAYRKSRARVKALEEGIYEARLFVAITEVVKSWPGGNGDLQWYYIGSHLRNCECATEEAREMIRRMHDGLLHGSH